MTAAEEDRQPYQRSEDNKGYEAKNIADMTKTKTP